MTQEEKQLLLKDLCARLPYGVIVRHECEDDGIIHYTDAPLVRDNKDGWDIITTLSYGIVKYRMKPYLRPMSSMTKEERKEYKNLFEYEEREYNQGCCFFDEYKIDIDDEYRLTTVIDWLDVHHFDYRGLIEKGLALEAPEGMYKTK